MKDQTTLYLRLLGAFNLALTVYRVSTFQWEQGSHHNLSQCIHTNKYEITKILCMIYNTKRSFKVLWGIRSLFTLVLFVKRIQSSNTCYGFWFMSTLAELCIKVYIVQNAGMDPPGIIQFCIELVMVYILTALLGSKPKIRLKQRQFVRLPILV